MVVELARRCPDTRFMLDHMGKPAIKDHALDPWREQLARLAALPNAWCKVSDLVTEADPLSWTPDDLAPTLPTRWRFLGKTGSCLEAIGLSSFSPPPMTGGSRRSIHSPGISPLRRRVNSGQKTHAIFIVSEEQG